MSSIYPAFKEALLGGTVNLTGTVKAVLINSTGEPYAAADVFYSSVAGAGIVGTPGTLANKTFTAGVFDADDITFTGVTGSSVQAVILFVDTGTAATSRLIAYLDGISVTPNGGNIIVSWDNGASKIFAL